MMKTILWDFDGVILDSMAIRAWGFKELFKNYTDNQVEALLDFHESNGGLSRYVKIRYFYEDIIQEKISSEKVTELAENFSFLMKRELTKKERLIQPTVKYLKMNHRNYNFHIVSGSDQMELRFLCEKLEIKKYFISILGSPIPKIELVSSIMNDYQYKGAETLLIGDSINDYDAAKKNNISFLAYNNSQLDRLSDLKPLY